MISAMSQSEASGIGAQPPSHSATAACAGRAGSLRGRLGTTAVGRHGAAPARRRGTWTLLLYPAGAGIPGRDGPPGPGPREAVWPGGLIRVIHPADGHRRGLWCGARDRGGRRPGWPGGARPSTGPRANDLRSGTMPFLSAGRGIARQLHVIPPPRADRPTDRRPARGRRPALRPVLLPAVSVLAANRR